MKLSLLLKSLNEYKFHYKVMGKRDIDVSGIADDTRKLKKGNLFVAINGLHVDAHELIPNAISLGASVIVCEKMASKVNDRLTYVVVENSRKALSLLASAWYGNPSKKLKVIGITGTKGKTTTAHVLYEIMRSSGKKVGLVTSIGAKIAGDSIDTGLHVTNPEPLILQELLSRMVKKSLDYVVLEVTSHGIDQERIAGIDFEVGILTNIASEHLDYHKSFQNYRRVKARLFENSKVSIFNRDDSSYSYLTNYLKGNDIISYSLNKTSDFKAVNIKMDGVSNFSVKNKNDLVRLKTRLIGRFNLYNVLAAVACARTLGIPWGDIPKSLANIKSPEGRLEEVKNKKGISIYIDFAHTPDSLESVLAFLRKKTKGNLIVVFGSAGERDKLKREVMGTIATKYADIAVLTAEDPRSESPRIIINSIARGAKKSGALEVDCSHFRDLVREIRKKSIFVKLPERGEAISLAINKMAMHGDTVVVCGKGHEKSMAYNGIEYPWSDLEAIKIALEGKVKVIKR